MTENEKEKIWKDVHKIILNWKHLKKISAKLLSSAKTLELNLV